GLLESPSRTGTRAERPAEASSAKKAGGRREAPAGSSLAANAQSCDQLRVTGFVLLLEVVKKRAAAGNQGQKATTGVVVLLVVLEMAGQIIDTLGQDRDLDFRRAGVAFLRGVFLDQSG